MKAFVEYPNMLFNRAKNGKGSTLKMTTANYDLIQKAVPGSTLYLTELDPEMVDRIQSRSKYPTSVPTHRITVLPPQAANATTSSSDEV